MYFSLEKHYFGGKKLFINCSYIVKSQNVGSTHTHVNSCTGMAAMCSQCSHHAARTQPLPVGDLGQRRVEAVDVVGGRAGVAAQQLPSVFTHPAELQVVVLFLAYRLLLFLLLILSLPLDPLFLLEGRRGRSRRLNTAVFDSLPPSVSWMTEVWIVVHDYDQLLTHSVTLIECAFFTFVYIYIFLYIYIFIYTYIYHFVTFVYIYIFLYIQDCQKIRIL